MRPTEKEKYEVIGRLAKLGIDPVTAQKLRRIAMTLRNWFELECGIENRLGGTSCIERDGGDGDGKPFLRIMYQPRVGKYSDTRHPIKDREAGAMKRLDKIMAGLRGLRRYVQTDPRGCSLYILRKRDVANGENINAVYTRGVAIY